MFDYREGELYEQTKDWEVKEVAKHIRHQLRGLVLPPGCKFSTRYTRGTGYSSIDIHLVVPRELMALRYELEGLHNYAWLWHIDEEHMVGRFAPLVPVAQAYNYARKLFDAYNYYEAPVYGDGCSVRYFGDITLTSEASHV